MPSFSSSSSVFLQTSIFFFCSLSTALSCLFRVQLKRFGTATTDSLKAIIHSKVLPKKYAGFKMVHARSEDAEEEERQKAWEDAEENELLFETKLTKVAGCS